MRHGEDDVGVLGGGFRGVLPARGALPGAKSKPAPPTASVYQGHVTPEWVLRGNFRLTLVNAGGISGLGGRAAKNGRFPG